MAAATRTACARPRLLAALLMASIVSTAVHYTDNFVAFNAYPGSDAISRPTIPITWAVLTVLGLLGYALYRAGRSLPAHALLASYALTGLTTPLHYLYGSPSQLPLWRNASILADGVIGLAILVFVARSWTSQHPLRAPVRASVR